MPAQEYLTIERLSLKEIARIFSKIIVSERGCWEWQGKRSKQGYGQIKFAGRDESVHRIMYAWLVEPLPRRIKGQKTPQIDHIVCDNPPCCNPVHLKLVAPLENVRRSSNNPTAINLRKTHCAHGHPLPSSPIGKGTYGRECRECRTERRNGGETHDQREARRNQVADYEQRMRYGPEREEWLRKRAEQMRNWRHAKRRD